jgi:hypothetical protein
VTFVGNAVLTLGILGCPSSIRRKRTLKRVGQVCQRRGMWKSVTTRRAGQMVRHARNRRYFGTYIGRTAGADLCSTMIHVDGGFWHLFAYAALQVIAKYFVPRHNHSQAGAAQHHEIARIERIDTARERRRPFVLIATNHSIHSEMYSDAFDFNAKLRP